MPNTKNSYTPDDDIRFMRMKQLVKYTSLSRAYLYNLIKETEFPSSITLNGIRMWEKPVIDEWLDNKIHGGK
jgi:predicted DNA-binding transcriptional regulator AlpA